MPEMGQLRHRDADRVDVVAVAHLHYRADRRDADLQSTDLLVLQRVFGRRLHHLAHPVFLPSAVSAVAPPLVVRPPGVAFPRRLRKPPIVFSFVPRRPPMTTRPPAEIGMSLEEVDTPALIIDLDVFERNLKRLAERVTGTGVRLRPHAKTHKCPLIALKQIELGAVGVCVQKVSEAEAMVYGGVRDVLVTNEVVGRQKLRHLMALAHTARIGVCVDDPSQVAALEIAAGEAGVRMPVHVEINMGGNRCGVEPGEPALVLARLVADAAHLSFAGLQAYHGSAQHLRGWAERRQAIRGAVEKAAMTRDLLAANGIACDSITGAGTGTFEFEAG